MNKYQSLVEDWMMKCFTLNIIRDKTERNNRFIEEALELVQSAGYTKEQVLKIVDYVFERPVGEVNQEVGGVMVTLAALCNVWNINIKKEALREIFRVDSPDTIQKIRAKQATKVNDNVAIDR